MIVYERMIFPFLDSCGTSKEGISVLSVS